MDTREHHRVVSISAKRSSWPLVEKPWLRARARASTAPSWSIREGIAANAAERIGEPGDSQMLARTGPRLNSNRTTGASSIQYP